MQTYLFHLGTNLRRPLKLLAVCATLAMPVAVPAAEITWQAPADIAAGSDVNTDGTQVFGRNFGIATGSTVNGVKFGYAEPWSVTYSEPGMSGQFVSGISGQTIGDPDAANYKAALTQTRYWGNTLTTTLGNLTIGQLYLVQFWVCDYRPYPNNRTLTVTGSGSNVNAPTLKFLDSDLSNTPGASHGQSVIGTWTADAATMTFTFTANEGVNMDALQLRALPSTETMAPTFSPAAGTYVGAQSVTLSCATPGATLYYTTDGSTPTNASPSGTSPVAVDVPAGASMTIQAYGHLAGYSDSAVSSATYTTLAISSGVWTQANGGSWGETTNWQGGVIPFGGTADFSTLALPADAIVTLDGDQTIGHLVSGDSGTLHDWHIDAGTGGTLTLDTGSVTPTLTVNNQTTTIIAVVAGTRGLAKAGTGTLALTGANTYTGATSANSGTLRVTDLASHRSPVTIASGATFEANVASDVSAPRSFNITGTGTLRKTGAGKWLIGDAGRVGIAMGVGGLLDIQEGSVSVGSHQLSFTGNQGALHVATGATLDFPAESSQFDALTGGGSLVNSYAPSGAITVTVGVAGGSGDFSGMIGSGNLINLTKTGVGTQVLTGANSYAGTTSVNGGVLQIGDGGTTGSIASGSAIVNNGTLAFNRSDSISQGAEFSGAAISGTGGLTQMGSGGLTLTANNSYTGTTAVNAGTLLVNGAISTGAVSVAVGATLGGTGTIGGNVTYSGGALAGFTPGSSLTVAGTLTLNDNVVHLALPSGLAAGTYPLATYNATGSTGAFAATPVIDSGSLAAGATAAIITAGGAVSLTVTSSYPFDIWANGTFANGALSDKTAGGNPDGDTLTNLQEFAFGTDPTVSTSGEIVYDATSVTTPGVPKIIREGGIHYVVFGRRADFLSAGILYTVRFSADLENGYWTTSTTEPEPITATGDIRAVRVAFPSDLVPSASGPQMARFVEVGVEQTTP